MPFYFLLTIKVHGSGLESVVLSTISKKYEKGKLINREPDNLSSYVLLL